MIRRSRRFASLPPFPLADMKTVRARLEADGVDVIDLGAGDAGLAPPPGVVARLQEVAGDAAYSRYPFQAGLRAFRQAVVDWMELRFGVVFDPDTEILPLIGSKDGIAHLPFAFMDEGDVAVVPDPGYTPYAGGVLLAGGAVHRVPLRAEHDFLVPLDGLPPEVSARARIVYLNYPNNPTAAVAPDEYLQGAIDFCRERGAVLANDFAYSELAFEGYRPRSIFELDGAREVAIEFHSLSKTYNMTGWRLGWAVGDRALIAALQTVKTFVDTGPFLAVQAAGVAALESWASWVPGNVATFRSRRDAAVDALSAAGFDVTRPRATMYLWIPVPRGEPSEAFARRALEQEGVIVLPGAAMGEGGEGYFRVALTNAEARLEEAAERLGRLS